MSKKYRKCNPQFLKVAEEWIVENGLMQYGGATLTNYCEAMGIHNVSHYNWLRDNQAYKSMIDRGIETYRMTHTKKLYNALMEQALGGYKENMVEDVDYKPDPNNPNKPMIAKKRTHKERRYVKGDPAAAIFLITNLDPQSFVNRQRTNVNITDKDGKDIFSTKTDEELDNIISCNKQILNHQFYQSLVIQFYQILRMQIYRLQISEFKRKLE